MDGANMVKDDSGDSWESVRRTADSGARQTVGPNIIFNILFLLDPPADKFFDMSQKQTVSPVQTVD